MKCHCCNEEYELVYENTFKCPKCEHVHRRYSGDEIEYHKNQYRNNKLIAEGSIISDFKLSPNDIVSATTAHDSPPDLVIQYSGGFAIARKDGDIIPLEDGDTVKIGLENVGFVQNKVEIV